jgi:hypothetical protein
MTSAELKGMIHQELKDMGKDEYAMTFKWDAILFGASASRGTTGIDSFTIPRNVHPMARLPSFELNGTSFKQVLPDDEWAPDHEFCIALMPFRPPSTGKTLLLVWFDLVPDTFE